MGETLQALTTVAMCGKLCVLYLAEYDFHFEIPSFLFCCSVNWGLQIDSSM